MTEIDRLLALIERAFDSYYDNAISALDFVYVLEDVQHALQRMKKEKEEK